MCKVYVYILSVTLIWSSSPKSSASQEGMRFGGRTTRVLRKTVQLEVSITHSRPLLQPPRASNLRRALPRRRDAKYTINGDNSAKFTTEGTGEAFGRGVEPIYRAHQTTDDMPEYESPTNLRLLTFNLSGRTRRPSSIRIGPTAGPNCFSKIDASSFRQAERHPGKTSGQDKSTGEGCAAASLQSNYNVCRVSFEQPPNEGTGKASEASKASPLACCSHDRHGFVSLFCVMVVCVSLSLCATALAGFAIYRDSSSAAAGTGLSLQHGTSWSIAQDGYIGKDMQTQNYTDTKGGLQSLN